MIRPTAALAAAITLLLSTPLSAQPPDDAGAGLTADDRLLVYEVENGLMPEMLQERIPRDSAAAEAVAGDNAALFVRWTWGSDMCNPGEHGIASYDVWTLDAGPGSTIAVQQTENRAVMRVQGLSRHYRLPPSSCGSGDSDLELAAEGLGNLVVQYRTSNHFSPRNFMALDMAGDGSEEAVLTSVRQLCEFVDDSVLPFYLGVERGAIPLDAPAPEHGGDPPEGLGGRAGPVGEEGLDGLVAVAEEGIDSFDRWWAHPVERLSDRVPDAGRPRPGRDRSAQYLAFRETMRQRIGAGMTTASAIGSGVGVVQGYAAWAARGFRNPLGLLDGVLTDLLINSPASPLAAYGPVGAAGGSFQEIQAAFVASVGFFAQRFCGGGPESLFPPVVVAPLRDPRPEGVDLPIDGDVMVTLMQGTCREALAALEAGGVPELESSSGWFSGPGIHTPIHGGFAPTQSVDPTAGRVGTPTPEMVEQMGIPQIDPQAIIEQYLPPGEERDLALDAMSTARITGSLATYRTPTPPQTGTQVWGTFGLRYGDPVEGADEPGDADPGDGGEPPEPPRAERGIAVVEIQPDTAAAGGAWIGRNPTDAEVELSGWAVDWAGLSVALPVGVGLPAGGTAVLALDGEAFAEAHPDAPAWPIPDAAAGRTRVRLLTERGEIADEVPLGAAGWPPTDGGHTLELVGVEEANDRPEAWRRSQRPGGTPGAGQG